MNPLAPTTCVRLLTALAAITLVLIAAGCGSSNNAAPNSQGFSKSSLSGTYVLSVSGTDVNANASTFSFFTIVGTVAADGGGNITGGTVDINDPDIGGIFTNQTLTASTYSVSQDGRGTATLVTPQGTFGLDFALTSASHGLVTRFDSCGSSCGSGSGTIDLQGSATQSSLTSLAFSLSGANSSQNPLGSVGAFTLDGSGNITAGLQDFNENGSSVQSSNTGLAVSGSVVLSSSTAGTAQLTTSSTFGTMHFDVRVIDSSHLKLISTNGGWVLSGDAFRQQTSFTAGQVVYTFSGIDSNGFPLVAGGYATTDANGTLTNGVEDYNDSGTANSSTFTGMCSANAPFAGGRCQLAVAGFSNGSLQAFTFAAYPSSGGVLLLEDDSLGLMQGAGYSQSATSFAASQGYGLNLSGANTDGTNWFQVDDIAQFDAGSPDTSLSGPTNMTGSLDENDVDFSLVSGVRLSGAYVPDSTATGRGLMNVTTNGTAIGGLSLAYYVVDDSNVLIIEGDQGQVAAGVIQLQSSSSSAVASARAFSMVRPPIRLPAFTRRKAN